MATRMNMMQFPEECEMKLKMLGQCNQVLEGGHSIVDIAVTVAIIPSEIVASHG